MRSWIHSRKKPSTKSSGKCREEAPVSPSEAPPTADEQDSRLVVCLMTLRPTQLGQGGRLRAHPSQEAQSQILIPTTTTLVHDHARKVHTNRTLPGPTSRFEDSCHCHTRPAAPPATHDACYSWNLCTPSLPRRGGIFCWVPDPRQAAASACSYNCGQCNMPVRDSPSRRGSRGEVVEWSTSHFQTQAVLASPPFSIWADTLVPQLPAGASRNSLRTWVER